MKSIKFVLFFALALALLAGCTPSGAPSPVSALKDGLGRSVSLPAPAKKIVSLAPSNTEILYALGAGGQLVGRDEFSDYPAEAKSVPSIGGSMGKYNWEKVASLQPDLVLASSLNTPEQVKALEDLKLTVYYLANPTTLDGLFANLEIIGKLTGREKEAAGVSDALRKRVQNVTEAVAKKTARPKVFYELDGSDPAKPWTAGPGSFIDTLILMAGGENAAARLKGDYAQISQEELLAANPDIILLGDAAYGVTPEQVARRAGWNVIAAVKNNKILAFDDNLVSRPSPRLVDGLEALLKIIHP